MLRRIGLRNQSVRLLAGSTALQPVDAMRSLVNLERIASSVKCSSSSVPSRRFSSVIAAAGKNGAGPKSSGGLSGARDKAQKKKVVEEEEEDSDEAVQAAEFGEDESNEPWDEEDDGEEFEGVDEIEEDENFEDDFEVFEDAQAGQLVDTAGSKWGETALGLARQVLDQEHLRGLGIELYAFRVVPASKKIDIRLDKLSDPYGSPSLDDVETFSRDFVLRLEQALGEAEAGQIEIEVSSPGAERPVSVPKELMRFRQLPMRVEYEVEAGKLDSKVFNVDAVAEDSISWTLADVRVNRGDRGRPMTKKQKSLKFDIPIASIKRVNLYIDV